MASLTEEQINNLAAEVLTFEREAEQAVSDPSTFESQARVSFHRGAAFGLRHAARVLSGDRAHVAVIEEMARLAAGEPPPPPSPRPIPHEPRLSG